MSKRLSKYITSVDCIDKSSGSISIASFAAAIKASIGIANASLTFSISTGFLQKPLKTQTNKKKHNKILMLARSKLNSRESKICEALRNNEISYASIMININEERNYRELKESIRMTNS